MMAPTIPTISFALTDLYEPFAIETPHMDDVSRAWAWEHLREQNLREAKAICLRLHGLTYFEPETSQAYHASLGYIAAYDAIALMEATTVVSMP